jgi:hypothetical protein
VSGLYHDLERGGPQQLDDALGEIGRLQAVCHRGVQGILVRC